MNDTEGQVTLAMDKALFESDDVLINAHPLRNDRTTSVRAAGEFTSISTPYDVTLSEWH